MSIMSGITLKRRIFSTTAVGTARNEDANCTVIARTRIFSGYWSYEVLVDSDAETFRSSGAFIQVMQAMKKNTAASGWIGLLKEVSGEVCDEYGTAASFFSKEQMLCIAALSKNEMAIPELASLLSIPEDEVRHGIGRLRALELVSRDMGPAENEAERKYKLTGDGELIRGLLLEDRVYQGLQEAVDARTA